jgi:hypothetical protein
VITENGARQGVASRPVGAKSGRRPGEWPEGCRPQGRDPREEELVREYAQREVFLGVVRADLERQPSPRTVRNAGRRWCKRIVQLAEEIAQEIEEAQR